MLLLALVFQESLQGAKIYYGGGGGYAHWTLGYEANSRDI
jgi:hypothetical protein